ncbi:DEAD/DEAH box helicase [Carboxylicivirga sediminis]|uniref:DEAD/DEAH box helicase n=1 Tax=Carboxylicivirga sediminis TaxID=2006564 RepID=A0A941F2E9_9BACT|nr:DEAD/DEAH box helicase [Carboxylicivirga sediminis]MBR8534505.1 DEAD/DEAH box helicase [Carboxylicivirga sediminis]
MEQFITVISEKRNIGFTLIPFYATLNESGTLKLIEQATKEHIQDERFDFTPAQKEVVKLLVSINEQNLFKRFSKQKNLKLFFEKLEEQFTLEHIRPVMDDKITQALEIISLSDIPVYFKDPNYSSIYSSDRIKVRALHDQPLFDFNLEPTGLKYTLKIKTETGEMGLTNREVAEITTSPCTFLINNQLFRFQNIDSKKFKPFLKVNHLIIQPRSVDAYMSSFVENCVRDFPVQANGFFINNKDARLVPLLILEHDLSQQPVFTLKFKYDDREYLAGTRSRVFVNHRKMKGHHIFDRFNRKTEEEQQIIETLIGLGLKGVSESQYRPINQQQPSTEMHQVVEWLNANAHTLAAKGIKVVQQGFEQNYYTGGVKLTMQYTEDNDWFDIKAVILIDEFKIPFQQIRQHIIRGRREFILPDKAVFIIPDEWFTKYTDLMHFVKADGEQLKLDKMHYNLLDQELLGEVSPQWQQRMEQLKQRTINYDTPDGLQATLRSYQLDGFKWMKLLNSNRFGGILADDMGLGKTIQTIALLLNQYETKAVNDSYNNAQGQLNMFDGVQGFNNSAVPASLIVMPTSLVHNWANELIKFAPNLKIYLYTGNNRTKSKEIGKILKHYHVVLTSYGIARNDIEYLKHYQFHYAILDESQNIKNPGSKIYQAVSDIQSTYKLVLTGTPIENALVDLWAQMNFVNKGLLGNLNFFKNHYAGPIEKKQDEAKEQKLRELINPFILRRTKEMVAKELPPVSEQTLVCDMTEEQQKFYEREKSGIRNELMKAIEQTGVNKNAILALQALTRLRQIANHPALVDTSYKGSSGKYEQIFEKLNNAISEHHKVLIFSSFVKDLELIEKDLIASKTKYAKLTGATGDRQKVIKSFTDDEDCRVFLISLKAGGVGLNLIEADYVFVLNPWWNPAAEAQAINRAHRIGQTKNVFVYKFIAADTIEEKIAKLQERKSALADTFITTNNPLKDLSENELRELFA